MMSDMAIHRHYLAGLDLAGRRVVVIGGGTVAQRRLPRLISVGAEVVLISPSVTTAVQAMVDAGELTWIPRRYTEGDLADAWYVLSCASRPEANAAVASEAERRRIFCVRADAGEQGSAVTPAVGEHGNLLLGVLSGGQPRRSAAVRDQLLEALREGRIVERVPVAGDGRLPGVALIGGGPGDPELITVRGRRLLARADVVVADRLAPRELLEDLPPHVQVIDAAKIPYGRSTGQDVINSVLVEHALTGKFVVRLKGGDPYVFGRGFEEALACAAAGVPVTMVPGVSSAFAVPAVAGVPVTHRGMAHEVVVVSGHALPGSDESLVDWSALARLNGTIVLLMGVHGITKIADELIRGDRPAGTPVAVIADGTMPTQRILRSTLGTVAQDVATQGIRPPAIIVVGPVVGLMEEFVD